MKRAHRQSGFTLIEILVTLLLSSILMLALDSSMSAVTRSQSLIDDYEQVQDVLRFTTAMMSRSLRSADALVDVSGTAETDAGQLSLERLGDDERMACNGEEPDKLFYETYSQVNKELRCAVQAEDGSNPAWEGTVTLAYDIESIEFECMDYDTAAKRDFSSDLTDCSSNHSDVIAVKTTITFDASELNEIEENIEHSFSATLRSRLNNCANGEDSQGNTIDCSTP